MIEEKASVDEIMRQANRHRVLIPAFNVPYLPMMVPIMKSLKKHRTFGLVEVALSDVEKLGAGSFEELAERYRSLGGGTFSRLHADHIPVVYKNGKKVDWERIIQLLLNLNYDSVMIDGSKLALEENISVTRKVVELAHNSGVAVEAALGTVFEQQEIPYEKLFVNKEGFTEIREAERFVKETGVDWLGVAIGNVHGDVLGPAKDEKKPLARLDIEHLKRLVRVTKIPLTLHGGSGIERPYMMEAIQNGISKINIGKSIRLPYRFSLCNHPNDIPAAQDRVAQEMDHLIEEYKLEGSWDLLGEYLGQKIV